jgi:hypothetical protein
VSRLLRPANLCKDSSRTINTLNFSALKDTPPHLFNNIRPMLCDPDYLFRTDHEMCLSLSNGTSNKNNESNTFSNGCLGSHTDEERSEMRYVMRIAKPVSHQNFERILHFLRGVCLLECLFIPTKNPTLLKTEFGFCSRSLALSKCT